MASFARTAMRMLGRGYPVWLLLGIWQLLASSGLGSPRLTPGLLEIARTAIDGLVSGPLLTHAATSLGRALAGFGLAILVGVPLGALMARSRTVESLLEPSFFFSYPVPKIALYPVFTFVFGLGALAKVAFVFLECLYPMVINSYQGTRSVARVQVWAARNAGATSWQLFWKLLLPASAGYIFTGLRIALPVALIVVTITEMLGDSTGLGFYITYAAASFEYPKIYAGALLVGLMGLALDRALVFLQKRFIHWQPGIQDIR